jgi:GNAT superfamily N-acetyltransferase
MITRLTKLEPDQIDNLLAASQREGFRFVARLCEEWENGSNRFNKPGEALFGLSVDGELVAIGGINRQDDSTGRLRRFYVMPANRRRRLGSRLLHHILDHAARHFRHVVLRTDTGAADRFYLAHGFIRIVDSNDATHERELGAVEPCGSGLDS